MSDPSPRRTPLTRERVLAAAAELADEEGLASVSMRRLAQRLGVVPMALYKHVADKDELLDGMVDELIARFEAPPAGLPWPDAVRRRLVAARRVVTAHAWARAAIESRTRRSPAVLAHMDATAGDLRAGGLSIDLTHHVMHTLGNRIWGFSPELFNQPPAPDAAPGPGPDPATLAELAARFPHIAEIAAEATRGDLSAVGGGCDEDFEFGFALDLLLDGAARLHQRGWTSASGRAGEGTGTS